MYVLSRVTGKDVSRQQGIFTAADADGDGKIDFNEYLDMLPGAGELKRAGKLKPTAGISGFCWLSSW